MNASPISAISSSSASTGPGNNRQRPVAGLSLLCLLTALPAAGYAQTYPGRFEITPYFAQRFGGTIEDAATDADAELDDGSAAGLVLNLRESDNTQWELIYARQSTDADVSELAFPSPTLDIDVESLQIGGTYQGGGSRYRPYLAATIGGTRLTPTLDDVDGDTFWSFSVGSGVQIFPESRVGLRVEARLWGTLLDTDTDLFCQSGPGGGLCAIQLDSSVLWQVEVFAGAVLRF